MTLELTQDASFFLFGQCFWNPGMAFYEGKNEKDTIGKSVMVTGFCSLELGKGDKMSAP